MILLFGTYAIGFAIQNPYLRLLGASLLLAGLVCVLRIKVCDKD